MINKSYSFSFIFHTHHTLEERIKIYRQYANAYMVRLYKLSEGFAFPELLLKEKYQEQDFKEANGLVVGEKVGVESRSLVMQ